MIPFLNGLGFGLVLILSLGPAFFLLVQTSIEKGFRKAAFIAFGISLADILFVILIVKGVTSLLEDPSVKFWAGIIGVNLLILFGLFTFFKKPSLTVANQSPAPESNYKSFITGFVFNFFNPSTVVFWLSIISIVQVNFGYSGIRKTFFFVGVLFAILSTDLTKSFLAGKLKRFLTVRAVNILNKAVGLILIGFGITLLTQLF
jgi:threonine/homoserine/homoserine lactone efflux protein